MLVSNRMFDKNELCSAWYICMSYGITLLSNKCISLLCLLLPLDNFNDHKEAISGTYYYIEVVSVMNTYI